MRKFIRSGFVLLWLCVAMAATAQVSDSIAGRLQSFAYALVKFGESLPEEKVYLHFDNTGYYQGDPIYFQCYVVKADRNLPAPLSKTLYVELLNPGGEIVSRQILPVRNGRCYGNFELTQLPFYPGFYEIRAYTRYMLNFGEPAVFSRVIPVFDRPKEEGDFAEKKMYVQPWKYPQKRERTKKRKKLNLSFFPEGGYLVEGVPVRVAFEATDAFGNPVDVSGRIVNDENEEITTFRTNHEGKGVFTYVADEDKDKAEVVWNNKTYRFDLPKSQSQGFVCSVDNLSSPDSLSVTIQKSRTTPESLLGLAILSHGQMQNFCMLAMRQNQPFSFRLDKKALPVGVSQVILFDSDGKKLSERLIFTGNPDTVSITAQTDKSVYEPYDSICCRIKVRNIAGGPVQSPLSVSVRDGWEEVRSSHSILTDLLLMSEVRGYVHRPSWYFESGDSIHRRALDEMLMVQGWKCYDWNHRIGLEPFDLKYLPERGIELRGQVVSMVRSKPRPNVQVSAFLMERGKDNDSIAQNMPYYDVFTTDSLGRFSFRSQIKGKWNLVFSVTEKGKKKDHRIVLDRVFYPEPRKYHIAEMMAETDDELRDSPDTLISDAMIAQEDIAREMKMYEDSLRRLGMNKKIHHLDEVVVKAKRSGNARDAEEARTRSIAYYDVPSEMDDIKDRNIFIGNDIHSLMINMNPAFYRMMDTDGVEYLYYKSKPVLFVINYERVYNNDLDYDRYRLLHLEAIKSIYISEDLTTMCNYADPDYTPFNIDDHYRCAVLIETYPEDQVPAKGGKGVRKTWLEGYSEVKDFYHPDYRVLPKENDYRRTLYWNPELMPDEKGEATIRFYNNSRCRTPRITIETLTADGSIGRFDK